MDSSLKKEPSYDPFGLRAGADSTGSTRDCVTGEGKKKEDAKKGTKEGTKEDAKAEPTDTPSEEKRPTNVPNAQQNEYEIKLRYRHIDSLLSVQVLVALATFLVSVYHSASLPVQEPESRSTVIPLLHLIQTALCWYGVQDITSNNRVSRSQRTKAPPNLSSNGGGTRSQRRKQKDKSSAVHKKDKSLRTKPSATSAPKDKLRKTPCKDESSSKDKSLLNTFNSSPGRGSSSRGKADNPQHDDPEHSSENEHEKTDSSWLHAALIRRGRGINFDMGGMKGDDIIQVVRELLRHLKSTDDGPSHDDQPPQHVLSQKASNVSSHSPEIAKTRSGKSSQSTADSAKEIARIITLNALMGRARAKTQSGQKSSSAPKIDHHVKSPMGQDHGGVEHNGKQGSQSRPTDPGPSQNKSSETSTPSTKVPSTSSRQNPPTKEAIELEKALEWAREWEEFAALQTDRKLFIQAISFTPSGQNPTPSTNISTEQAVKWASEWTEIAARACRKEPELLTETLPPILSKLSLQISTQPTKIPTSHVDQNAVSGSADQSSPDATKSSEHSGNNAHASRTAPIQPVPPNQHSPPTAQLRRGYTSPPEHSVTNARTSQTEPIRIPPNPQTHGFQIPNPISSHDPLHDSSLDRDYTAHTTPPQTPYSLVAPQIPNPIRSFDPLYSYTLPGKYSWQRRTVPALHISIPGPAKNGFQD